MNTALCIINAENSARCLSKYWEFVSSIICKEWRIKQFYMYIYAQCVIIIPLLRIFSMAMM